MLNSDRVLENCTGCVEVHHRHQVSISLVRAHRRAEIDAEISSIHRPGLVVCDDRLARRRRSHVVRVQRKRDVRRDK
jgi:hypothetical protein